LTGFARYDPLWKDCDQTAPKATNRWNYGQILTDFCFALFQII
jgi:hypothetical protein